MTIHRQRRRAWIGERELALPRGALHAVLCRLAEIWDSEQYLRHGTSIPLASGGVHVFDHDDVKRIRRCLREAGCELDLIESVRGLGHRLRKTVWPPLELASTRTRSGTHVVTLPDALPLRKSS